MKKAISTSCFLFVIFSSLTNVQTKGIIGKGSHKTKRWIRRIVHKPIKHLLDTKHKKHDVLTLAAPPRVGSLLPSASSMTLMPNGVPAATGEYIHHLIHRHPLNIPVYDPGYHPHGLYPVHVPEHFGPLGPFGRHGIYRHAPWLRLGYGIGYPFSYGFMSGPRYGPLPGHGFGHWYHRHFGHALPWPGFLRHGPADYGYELGHGFRRGLGLGYGNGHGRDIGNWWFKPLRGWYPYSFDHSVDLRGDSGPETMFVEKSSVPSKRSKIGGKLYRRRIIKTGPSRKASRTRKERVHLRGSRLHRLLSLRHRIIPFRFRIQRYKILIPLKKKKIRHPNASIKKLKHSLKKSKTKK